MVAGDRSQRVVWAESVQLIVFRPTRDGPPTNSRAFKLMMLRVGAEVMRGGMCQEVRDLWAPFLADLSRCVAEKKMKELVLPNPVSAAFFGKSSFVVMGEIPYCNGDRGLRLKPTECCSGLNFRLLGLHARDESPGGGPTISRGGTRNLLKCLVLQQGGRRVGMQPSPLSLLRCASLRTSFICKRNSILLVSRDTLQGWIAASP